MIITKVADKEDIPSWMNEGIHKNDSNNQQKEEVGMLTVSDISDMDNSAIAQECDKIETCASNGSDYACNCEWPSTIISHLHEYAIACGLPSSKFHVVATNRQQSERHSEDVPEIKKFASQDKVEESIPTKEQLLSVMTDPFHVDEHTDTSHMDRTKWEQVEPERKMADAPVIMGNSIIALRGGENYNINREDRIPKGQNSIVNPGAIEDLAKSDTMTPGERLAADNARITKEREKEKGSWEDERIQAMSHRNIIPHGKVFPTETLNAQPGTQHTPSMFKPEIDIPERTAGEKLAEQNEVRRQSIQREKPDNNWEQPQRASSRSISDLFGEELNKYLGG